MPEGPSLVILKEALIQFEGKKIADAYGNSKIKIQDLINDKVIEFKTWGKHFIIITKKNILRVHFLLFGSYSLNEQTKPDKSLRLCLKFKNGSVFFYTCAIKHLDPEELEDYDWKADVMSDEWDPIAAKKKLQNLEKVMVCDALLTQSIFSGVGNIIKNEVLYRIRLHPETVVENIPSRKLSQLIKEARIYSFEFLEWKKNYELKKHWLAHTKKVCKRCNLPFTKAYSGTTKRRTFFCSNCQVLYL